MSQNPSELSDEDLIYQLWHIQPSNLFKDFDLRSMPEYKEILKRMKQNKEGKDEG